MLIKLYSALGAIHHAISPQMEQIGYFETEVLQALGAKSYRMADYEKDSAILSQIQTIYNKEGMDAYPKVILYEQDVPNAAFIHTGTIVISTGLIDMLDKQERETVLAHEIVHQQQNSTNMFAAFAYMATVAMGGLFISNQVIKSIPERFSGALSSTLIFGLVSSAVNALASIPFFAHKRHQEFKADEGSAWITQKPRKLISALSKLEKFANNMREKEPTIGRTDDMLAAGISAHAAAHEDSLANQLYSTHPPTAARIEKLEAIHQEQQAQRAIAGKHSAKVVTLPEESHVSSSPQRA